MPQVRITRATVVNRASVRVGDVVNVTSGDAAYLVRLGKAEALPAVATATAAAPPDPAPASKTTRARRAKPSHEDLQP